MTQNLSLPVGGRLPARKKQWDPPKWMYPIIYNKWKILIGALFAALLFCAFGFAHAELLFSLDSMIEGVFSAVSPDQYKDWFLITSDFNMAEFSTTTVSSFVKSICNNVFKPIGTALVIIYWGIGFFDMLTSSNQVVLEQMVKKLIILVIGIAVVTKADLIVGGCLDITTGIWTSVSGIINTGGGDPASLAESFILFIGDEMGKQSNMLGQIAVGIGYLVQLLLPWLVSLVAGLGLKWFAISRYLEICVLGATAPLMFSDISNSHGGFAHSGAFRGIKQIFAVCLQGLIILMCIFFCGLIMSSYVASYHATSASLGEFSKTAYVCVAITAAQLGIAAKSQQISRQLVGLG